MELAQGRETRLVGPERDAGSPLGPFKVGVLAVEGVSVFRTQTTPM